MDTPFRDTLAMAGSLEGPETPISTDSTVRPSSSLTMLSSAHWSAGCILYIPSVPGYVHRDPAHPQHLPQVSTLSNIPEGLSVAPCKECMLGRFVHLMRVSNLACGSDLS